MFMSVCFEHFPPLVINNFWECVLNVALWRSVPICSRQLWLQEQRCVCVPLSHCLFFSPPELLFDLSGKRIENWLLDNQAAAFQQFTLSQFHWQTLQPVPPELQLRQVDQLAETRRQRLQVVITQIQSAQLLTLEQLWRKLLNLKKGKMGKKHSDRLIYINKYTKVQGMYKVQRNTKNKLLTSV